MCSIILISDNIPVTLCVSGFLWMCSVVCVAATSTPAAAKGTARAGGAPALPSQMLHPGLCLRGFGVLHSSCREPGNPGTSPTLGMGEK